MFFPIAISRDIVVVSPDVSAMTVLEFSQLETEVHGRLGAQLHVHSRDRCNDLPRKLDLFHYAHLSFNETGLVRAVLCHQIEFLPRVLMQAAECHKIIHENSRIHLGEAVTCIVEYGNFLPGPDDRQHLLVLRSSTSLAILLHDSLFVSDIK